MLAAVLSQEKGKIIVANSGRGVSLIVTLLALTTLPAPTGTLNVFPD
jgi:hypothetical protein